MIFERGDLVKSIVQEMKLLGVKIVNNNGIDIKFNYKGVEGVFHIPDPLLERAMLLKESQQIKLVQMVVKAYFRR